MKLTEAMSRLRQMGIKLTPQRQEILRVLLEKETYYSAEEILQQVKRRYPSISLDTVYRTLYLFKKLGLVTELNFQEDGCRRFELNLEGKHHHHLICLKCGQSRKLTCCPTDCLAMVQEQNPEFEIASHSFEIYGYCQGCKA